MMGGGMQMGYEGARDDGDVRGGYDAQYAGGSHPSTGSSSAPAQKASAAHSAHRGKMAPSASSGDGRKQKAVKQKSAAAGSAAGAPAPGVGTGSAVAADDQYGLLGLLAVIRMTDVNLNTLALGQDLTTLGLNLNSQECLYSTFGSPWSDPPSSAEPDFSLPPCYTVARAPTFMPSHMAKFKPRTLFYIFYCMPRDAMQVHAAIELHKRHWQYHKALQKWFTLEQGAYMFFDTDTWDKRGPFQQERAEVNGSFTNVTARTLHHMFMTEGELLRLGQTVS